MSSLLKGRFQFDAPEPEEKIQVSFAGRLDNRAELLDHFKAAGMPPSSEPSEIIRKAYRLWKLSFASRLRGDFAAAVWDGREKLGILVRDPIGLKPLYYFQNSREVIFSSRLRALFEDPAAPKKANDFKIGQFFAGEFLDYESTFFEKIMQVPPAHALIFNKDGKTEKKRYWFPDISEPPKKRRDFKDYLEEFYSLFEASVKNRISGAAPAGLLLSGGLDSAQIAAMAETLRLKNPETAPLKSVCLLSEGFLTEEKMTIDRIREHYASDVEILDYTPAQKTDSLFELYREPGEIPYYDAFMTIPLLLENLAGRGCKTLMTGFGANEFSHVMEFGYLEDLLIGCRFKKFSREAEKFAECTHQSQKQVIQTIALEVLREKTPDFVRRRIRRRRSEERQWLRPEFRKKMTACPPPRLRPFGELAQDETYHALFEPQIPLALSQMEEASGRYGLEISHPFLDLPLIEFFLSVPAEIKMAEGYRKSFIQHALRRIMPFPVRTADDERSYIPFPEVEARKKLERARLRHYLQDPQNLIYASYIDYSGVQTLLNRPALNLPLLWRLVRLESWLQSFWGQKPTFINDFTHSKRYNFAEQAT